MKRALSEPRGNPFWSDRARSEFQLQRQRPLDLPNPTETPVRDENLPPVPNELGEWSDGSERNPLQDVSSSNQVRKGRQSSRDRSLRSDGDSKSDLPRGSFQTPASWQKSEGLMPTNGEMAVGQESVHEGLKPECAMEEVASGLKTEGRMPGATPEAESRQTLEQAMGDELVQHLLKENEDLKRNLMEIQSMLARNSSQQPSSGSWSNVSPFVEVAPMTPRAVETCEVGEKRFTPGGTQVPLGPPPDDGFVTAELVPPSPVPPFPDLERYEKIDGGKGPCHREIGRDWVPVQQRTGNPNSWVLFPGENSRVQDWYLRQALSDWDRRHGRPDQSWRSDWNPSVESTSHLHPGQCQEGRASLSTGGGVLPHPSRVCPDDRAFASAVLGEQGRIAPVFENSGASQCGGEPPGDRALHGTVLGVQGPRFNECHGDRVSAIPGQCREAQCGGGPSYGASYHDVRPGHQQLDCGDLCDPMEERASRPGTRGRDKSPTEGLRSTNPTLPKLPLLGQRHSSVDASDWLAEVRPLVGDLSTMSSLWWDLTLKHVMKSYNQWISATPLERLRQKPPETRGRC